MSEILRDYLGRGLDFDCPAQQFLFDVRIVGEIRGRNEIDLAFWKEQFDEVGRLRVIRRQ